MEAFVSPNFRTFGFFLFLLIFCCSPIWTVEYFVNQDGSAHLYSSFIMLELLKGNPLLSEIYTLNSISIPNSSGHWLMVLLFNFFSPLIITKIIVTLTFTGFIASIGWLRLKTVGSEGLKTSLLIGAALGFNWLWFVGFYNFIIGVCFFAFTTGLFYGWREKMNIGRTIVLALMFLIAYFSHIVSFAVLAGTIVILVFSASKENFQRNLLFILAAILPVLPLLIIYKSVSASGGGFFPVWRSLDNPFSPVSWLSQIRTADPFIIISRKSFPFYPENSSYFSIFMPVLWIFSAIFFLAAASWSDRAKSDFGAKSNLIFLFLFFSSVFAAIVAPDDFGLNNGSVLRERLLLCGLVFFVPLFRVDSSFWLKRIAQFCLLFVISFQTAALWEYSINTSQKAKDFFSLQTGINSHDTLAAVAILDDDLRFHSAPLTMINNYMGIGPEQIVWDNYEIGHYLFPVIAKTDINKQFVFDLTRSTTFSVNFSNQKFEEQLSNLDSLLTANHQKITTLFFWGRDPRVELILNKWFEQDTVLKGERVRIFRHR